MSEWVRDWVSDTVDTRDPYGSKKEENRMHTAEWFVTLNHTKQILFVGKDTRLLDSNIKSNVKCTTFKYLYRKYETLLYQNLVFLQRNHDVICFNKHFCDIFRVTVYCLNLEMCQAFIVNLLQYSYNTIVYTLKLNIDGLKPILKLKENRTPTNQPTRGIIFLAHRCDELSRWDFLSLSESVRQKFAFWNRFRDYLPISLPNEL